MRMLPPSFHCDLLPCCSCPSSCTSAAKFQNRNCTLMACRRGRMCGCSRAPPRYWTSMPQGRTIVECSGSATAACLPACLAAVCLPHSNRHWNASPHALCWVTGFAIAGRGLGETRAPCGPRRLVLNARALHRHSASCVPFSALPEAFHGGLSWEEAFEAGPWGLVCTVAPQPASVEGEEPRLDTPAFG